MEAAESLYPAARPSVSKEAVRRIRRRQGVGDFEAFHVTNSQYHTIHPRGSPVPVQLAFSTDLEPIQWAALGSLTTTTNRPPTVVRSVPRAMTLPSATSNVRSALYFRTSIRYRISLSSGVTPARNFISLIRAARPLPRPPT